MKHNSKDISQQFSIMCGFIDLAPNLSNEEIGDILYNEFIKRSGYKITKEELVAILAESEQQTYFILDDEGAKSLNYASKDKIDEALRIASRYVCDKPSDEAISVQVKLNNYKL